MKTKLLFLSIVFFLFIVDSTLALHVHYKGMVGNTGMCCYDILTDGPDSHHVTYIYSRNCPNPKIAGNTNTAVIENISASGEFGTELLKVGFKKADLKSIKIENYDPNLIIDEKTYKSQQNLNK